MKGGGADINISTKVILAQIKSLKNFCCCCNASNRLTAHLDVILLRLMSIVPSKICSAQSQMQYRIAGNIGGEFNLADWQICESTAKLNSAKYESCQTYGVSD